MPGAAGEVGGTGALFRSCNWVPERLEQRNDLCGAAEGKRWLSEQTGSTVKGMKMSDLEGYEEAIRKVLEGLSPEQRLAGLAPEQRLAGLTAEQALLALPDETLRGFTDAYLATLSEPTRAAIRARIGR